MPTPSVYTFIQKIDYPMLLVLGVRGAGLSVILDHVDTVGSGSFMEVSLYFPDILTENDVSTLNSFMSNYSNPNTSSMVTSVVNALQTDANLLLILRTRVSAAIPSCSYGELQALCTLLGITS